MRTRSRARVDPSAPEAFAICDVCGQVRNRPDLQPQMRWSGRRLVPTGHLACEFCLDEPNESLRTIALPLDPRPVVDPRPPEWAAQQGDPPPVQSVAQLIWPDDVQNIPDWALDFGLVANSMYSGQVV